VDLELFAVIDKSTVDNVFTIANSNSGSPYDILSSSENYSSSTKGTYV
jgi:hypothetical protein